MIPQFTADEIRASICKDSLLEFVREFWSVDDSRGELILNWHIKYLCKVLQEAVERVIEGKPKEHDIVINQPPGTTKSMIVSVMLDAWAKAKYPGIRFLGASYAQNLAQELSLKTRDIIKSEKFMRYFPEVTIRDEQDSKTHFITTKGGVRYAIGSGGVVIGMHFHIIAIDDPIDPQSAVSEVEMKEVNRWIDTTLSQRKIDKAVTLTILVMQRLSQGDPTDEFLKANDCFHICLPAEDSEDVKPKYLRKRYRKRKGLLDPIRLSEKVLEKEKKRGDYFYAGQYRQNPIPPGGAKFQVDKLEQNTMRVPPDIVWKKLVRYWDKAASKSKRAAHTVGVQMGEDSLGRIWVLDVIRGKWDSLTREHLIQGAAKSDGYNTIIAMEQEPGSGGLDSVRDSVRRLQGYRVAIDKVTGDKELRADPFSSQVNAGNVYLREAPWNKEYLDELRYFPYSKFKDQVDASGGCYSQLVNSKKRAGAIRSHR